MKVHWGFEVRASQKERLANREVVMFRPRNHGSVREKALMKRARWTTIGAFAMATCMHWTGGCASTGERWSDSIVESEETLPEMGSGPGSGVMLVADETSEAFRPEPLTGTASDEPRTGRNTKLAMNAPQAAGELGTGKHDGAIMDLDAALPSEAAPLLVPSGKSDSSLAMKLDEEKMKRDDAERAAIVADNDRLLAEATASLVAKPKKAKTVHVAKVAKPHKAKKAPRSVLYAKRAHSAKKAVRLASAKPIAPAPVTARANVERWKPTLPPMIASTDPKPVAPASAPAPAPAANTERVLASMAPVPAMPQAKPASGTTTPKTEVDTKTKPKLASVEMGSAFARHLGLLFMGVGALVLLCLFFLSKSRRDNQPMDW